MKVAFATLGCRVNVYESEAMAEKFIREGYEVVDFNEFSDVYVINTCTVTNMGDKKSRQIISRARRTNPDAIIAAVGCYSQMAPKEVAEIPGVDVVLGTRNKGDVVYYVNKAKDEGQPQVHVQPVLQNKKFEDVLGKINDLDLFIVPYENAENFGVKTLINKIRSEEKASDIKSVGIFVGPEGGIEEEEIEKLKEKGAHIVTLGKRILRTETAGFVATALIQYELSDLGGND